MPQRPDLPLADTAGLSADCGRCFGLCCVAPAFATSVDFAITKPAHTPCPHLEPAFGCGIHSRLRESGFRGCTVYDCFGAGQQVAQVTYGGVDWRAAPHTAGQMYAVFAVMRVLHELLWYLAESLALEPAAALRPRIDASLAQTRRLTELPAQELADLDVEAHRASVSLLLAEVSEAVRAQAPRGRGAPQARPPWGRPDRRRPGGSRPARRQPERGIPDRGRPPRCGPAGR